MMRKFITYFENEGENYTEELINAVKDKLDASDDINTILIASATGESALKLAEAIDGDAGRGVTNKYGGYTPLDVVADTFRMFSHGIKVAAEISIMAADAGLVDVGEEIIAIGGRGHGVDSAVILTPVNAKDLFNLKIKEIIAMPRDWVENS